MIYMINKARIFKHTLIVAFVLLIIAGIVFGIAPKGTEVGVLQFDGIIELNSTNMKTHVLVFVRYWVSPDFYNASIIWAEPHIGSLNYPIYPPTTIIDSNEKSFSINNDVLTQYNSTFSKPLGDRGVFKYMFNDYPIVNIRFAESEALASRIYTTDLEKLSEPNDSRQTAEINKNVNEKDIKREVAGLNLQANDGRINSLELLDEKERLIKNIEYEYSGELLKRQNILLPERPIVFGYQSGGIKLTINGQQRMIKQLASVQHEGSRKCSVDYETKKIGDKTLSLPVKIVVYAPDGKNILRTSRMMNYKQVKLNQESVGELSKDFVSFDDNDWDTRKMLLKYWMENPEKIEEEDLKLLRELQKHFEDIPVAEKDAGENLRRINMLLQLDWMLGDSEKLQEHFQTYLELLSENNFYRMLLIGGQQVIEQTFRWGHYAAADKLLQNWINEAVKIPDTETVLNFAASLIDKDRFWETIRLLDKSIASSQIRGQKRFDAMVLRCAALHGLYEMLNNPGENLNERRKAQASWVLSSTSIEKILETLKESIGDSQKEFANINNPSPQQKEIKKN